MNELIRIMEESCFSEKNTDHTNIHETTSVSVRSPTYPVIIKLADDIFRLYDTFIYTMNKEECLARYNGEIWLIVPMEHFMDFPDDLSYFVDWQPIAIATANDVAYIPSDPNIDEPVFKDIMWTDTYDLDKLVVPGTPRNNRSDWDCEMWSAYNNNLHEEAKHMELALTVGCNV